MIRGIFRVESRFPLHFVFYIGNLDYFLDSVRSSFCKPVTSQLILVLYAAGGQAGRADPAQARKIHRSGQLDDGKVVVEECPLPEQGVQRDPAHGVPLLTRFIILEE